MPEPAPSRERIQAVAATLFRERGYHGIGVREVAGRAGIAKSTFYHHFASKDALLYEIVQHTVDVATPRLRAIALSSLPAPVRLREAIDAHVRQLVVDLDNVTCFIEEGRFLPDAYLTAHIASRDAYESLFRAVLEDGVRDGSFRAGLDVRITSLALLGMCNWMARWYRPEGDMDPEAIAAQLGELAMRAVLADRPGRR